MMQHPGVSAQSAAMATATAAAVNMGLGENWPLIAGGVLVGMCAKAAALLSTGRRYGGRELVIDLLMAAFLFIVAGFVVETWGRVIAIPLAPFGTIVLAAGLALGGDKLRPLVARFAVGTASKALGQVGSTADVVLPPAPPGPEASKLIHKLSREPGGE